MKNIIKSITAVTMAMFAVACSNSDELEQTSVATEGIPFEIEIGAGESTRFTYLNEEVTETRTPYKWSKDDKVFVIGENGEYLGTVTCTEDNKKLSVFKADRIPLQEGQKIHLWFFGQAQGAWGGNEIYGTTPDVPSIKPADLKSSMYVSNAVQFDKELKPYQLGPNHTGPNATKYNEILSKSATVTISNGVATLQEGTIVMNHLTSVATIHLSNPYSDKVTIKGCYNKARIDLVAETLKPESKGDIVYYNNHTNGEVDEYEYPEYMDVVLFPGETSPVFEYVNDKIAYSGYMSTVNVQSGIHYIDYTTGKDNNYAVNVRTEPDLKNSAPIVFNKFDLGDDSPYYFSRGLLYAAVGNSFPRKVELSEEQYILPLTWGRTNDTGVDYDEYCWSFLDNSKYPEYVFDATLPGTHFESVTKIEKTDEFNPVYVYNQQHKTAGYNFELPSTPIMAQLISRYYWTPIQITDTDEDLTYQRKPQGLLFSPVSRFDSKAKQLETLGVWMNQFNTSSEEYKLIKKLYDAVSAGKSVQQIEDDGWFCQQKTDASTDFTQGTKVSFNITKPFFNGDGKLMGQALYIVAKNNNGSVAALTQCVYMCSDVNFTNHLPNVLHIINSTSTMFSVVQTEEGGSSWPFAGLASPVYYIRPVLKAK